MIGGVVKDYAYYITKVLELDSTNSPITGMAQLIRIRCPFEDVDWNVKMSNGDTPIMHCLKVNKMEMFNILVECPRVDLNIKDNKGDSLAIWALNNDCGRAAAVARSLQRNGVILRIARPLPPPRPLFSSLTS